MALKLKKGDLVHILRGRDRGKRGKIIQLFSQEEQVVVEGINLRFKHLRAQRQGQSGQRVQFAAPLGQSKVQLVCPHCSSRTRLAVKVAEGKRQRFCKKCQQSL